MKNVCFYKELPRKAEEIFGKAKIREALMKEKDIHDTLNHLLNEKISYITRAVNMLCLGSGDCITILDTKGNMVEKSVMSLHIQSEWRITNRKKKEILLASSDFYVPNSTITDETNFEWDIKGNNLFDEKSQIWLNERTDLFIKAYNINSYGDLQLTFSNDEQLTTFTDASNASEAWRFFRISDEKHLVFTGFGCEFE